MTAADLETDPRYTLSDIERNDVISLKEKCDKEGVSYSSIFELAKYCLVTSSIKDEAKRRTESFDRIKMKRVFEEKYKLDELDIFEVIEEIQDNIPDWAISCGKINEKWCVGYTSKSSNPDYMNKEYVKIFKLELTRFDLAASDLEEARKGFYIFGTSKDLKANSLKSVRTAVKLKPLFSRMNANRVKGVFYEAPAAIVMLSSIFLSVVPKTVRERMNLVKSLKDCKFGKDHAAELVENLPKDLGGEYEKSLEQWFRERIEVRKTTDEKVMLV